MGAAVHDDAQTSPGAGLGGQPYLLTPVCGSTARRLSPPDVNAATNPSSAFGDSRSGNKFGSGETYLNPDISFMFRSAREFGLLLNQHL
jgi:hypothetical protein